MLPIIRHSDAGLLSEISFPKQRKIPESPSQILEQQKTSVDRFLLGYTHHDRTKRYPCPALSLLLFACFDEGRCDRPCLFTTGNTLLRLDAFCFRMTVPPSPC